MDCKECGSTLVNVLEVNADEVGVGGIYCPECVARAWQKRADDFVLEEVCALVQEFDRDTAVSNVP